jgi:hypothetical protein
VVAALLALLALLAVTTLLDVAPPSLLPPAVTVELVVLVVFGVPPIPVFVVPPIDVEVVSLVSPLELEVIELLLESVSPLEMPPPVPVSP